MNWQVNIRLMRGHSLTDVERDKLLGHVREIRKGPGPNSWDLDVATGEPVDGVVAAASLDMSYRDPHDADNQRLCHALTLLRKVLPDAQMEVCDEYELIGWDEGAQRYAMSGHNDVPKFGIEFMSGFLRLGSLSYDHRFAERVTHTASRVDIPGSETADTPLTFAEPPVFVEDDHRGELRRIFAAWVRNGTANPVNITNVEATLLDASGFVVDHASQGTGLVVRNDARLLATVPGSAAAQRRARTVSLVVEIEQQFEHFLGAYTLDRTSAPPEMTLFAEAGTAPSPFPVQVTLGGFIDVDQPDRNWRLVIELCGLQPGAQARVDLVLDLFDAHGRTIATERKDRSDVGQTPTRVAMSIWHGAHELSDVTRMELRGHFRVTRMVQMGAFALPES